MSLDAPTDPAVQDKEEQDTQLAIANSLADQMPVDVPLRDATMGAVAGNDESPNPFARTREDSRPAGLKNVGNTCYVNSILQSYFALPQFRRNVLSLSFPASDATAPTEQVGYPSAASAATALQQMASAPNNKRVNSIECACRNGAVVLEVTGSWERGSDA